jgi:uncharacterized protein DUF6597
VCQDPLVPYRELVPHRALRPFVDRLWTDGAVGAEPRRIVPDGCIDLLISSLLDEPWIGP